MDNKGPQFLLLKLLVFKFYLLANVIIFKKSKKMGIIRPLTLAENPIVSLAETSLNSNINLLGHTSALLS